MTHTSEQVQESERCEKMIKKRNINSRKKLVKMENNFLNIVELK